MLNKENMKALSFALILCLICAALLSGLKDGLRVKQEKNAVIDVKKNILKALKIETKEGATITDIEALYDQKVKALALDNSGKPMAKAYNDLSDAEKANAIPVYQALENGKIVAYAIPISGKGLWSTLYGFLALESDLNTVKGITFYKHGETPGLGAEIDQDWFQNNFVGKKILDENGNLVSIKVFKGKVEATQAGANHLVDGISGATMTANGVTRLLEKDLTTYEKYFSTVRSAN